MWKQHDLGSSVFVLYVCMYVCMHITFIQLYNFTGVELKLSSQLLFC